MSCFHPLTAFRPRPGSGTRSLLVMKNGERLPFGAKYFEAPIFLPCGQCIDCRVENSRQWAIRCMHEASLYEDNCFITLTYSDKYLPAVGSLVPRDFQLFMHKLRKFARTCGTERFPKGHKIRFYGCGEYGDQFGRPHYHALIFNFDFEDKKPWRHSVNSHALYRSDTLEKLWSYGNCEVGAVSFESAAYVARYCVKKVTGEMAAEHYHCVDAEGRSHFRHPEFGRMSNRPGIGDPWLRKFHTDVYNQDFVVMRGVKMKPPKFYDKKYQFLFPSEFEDTSLARMRDNWFDNRLHRRESTPERLAVKEEIVSSRYALYAKRRLD